MIHHACFKCKRRFELDPVFVGFELNKLKQKKPSHYQAICPACRAVNKVSVQTMQSELAAVAAEVEAMTAEYEENKAKGKAERKAKAGEGNTAENKAKARQ